MAPGELVLITTTRTARDLGLLMAIATHANATYVLADKAQELTASLDALNEAFALPEPLSSPRRQNWKPRRFYE